ncbi:MAG: hypothetical protein OEM26_19765, partial [Saprospiraceae bacterium]|nr:hypothetical protein [Saprospiraceae bacterium]
TVGTEPLPDDKASILQRFAHVFEQSYTRFLDLKKAEAQAREAQIEAALEKVRARAMGMHHSDELHELIGMVFTELTKLDLVLTRCIIMEIEAESKSSKWWMSNSEAPTEPMNFFIQHHEHAPYLAYLQAWKNRELRWNYDLQGKVKKQWDDFLFSETELAKLPDFVIEGMKEPDQVFLSVSFNNFGCLSVASLQPLAEEHVDLLARFSKVFEQTYTRFLDLKNAEAQAREAQIEAALERIRSKSMAMQHSGELGDVAVVVFKQLQDLQLGTNWTRSWIALYNDQQKVADAWFTSFGGETPLANKVQVPLYDNPMFERNFEQWKKGSKYLKYAVVGDEATEVNSALAALSQDSQFDENKSLDIHAIEGCNKYGTIGIASSQPVSEETIEIIQRFSSVFEQTYTRFLDLKNAEAQAREARIEAALEKVRSRTMGMQKSEELEEVIKVVFDQFVQLDIFVQHTGFLIDYQNRDDMLIWLADENAVFPQISIPYFDSPHWNSFRDAKEKGRDLFTNHLNFEEKNRFYQELFTHIPDLTEETKDYYFHCPGLAISTVLMDNIGLYIENFEGRVYSDEENSILLRFGKVFQQTYTRFLDLQKAEAQAREALIEAALEKVRSRTMGMQKSEELPQAANLLFQQIQSLGMPAWSAGYCIWKDNKKAITAWMSSEGVLQPPFVAPTTEDELFMEMRKGQEQGKTFHLVEMGGEDLVAHYEYMRTLPVVGEILDSIIDAGHPLPTFQIMHYTYFSHGLLLFITYEPVPEAHPIFKRFAKVFEQTYTRFLDLQTAEAQAREAQIEAALEKVRSRTMAMQKSEELPEVAHELFLQIQSLGIPTWSAGYNILSEDKKASTCIMSSE